MPKIHSSPFARAAGRAGVAVVLLATLALAACNKKDYTAFALTSTGSIIEFATNKPTKITNKATVNGLSGSQTLLQIAYRPSNGLLYGVTSDYALCQVDPLTATVSSCFSAFTTDRLSNVAISFDPVTDTLRVVANDASRSGGHLNVLIDPTSGAYISTQIGDTLDYSDSTSGTPQINAIAYDNPIAGASSTTLFALDVNNLSLDRIGDKNAGNASSVTNGGVRSIGATAVNFTSNIGFTIAPQDGTAYAVLGGAASLYTIDLGNGAATLVGAVHDADYTLISLAIAPNS